MTAGLFFLNNAAVGLYGTFLSAVFSDVYWDKKNKRIFGCTVLFLAVLQIILYIMFDADTIRKLYPFITHLPLMLILTYLSRKPVWSIIAVLIAYLCCQLRRWMALLVVALFQGGDIMQVVAELAVTLPLLVLLCWIVPRGTRMMAKYPIQLQLQFGALPLINYLFDYLTRVYTKWLVQGVSAAVEFMPFICVVFYLIFVLYGARILQRQGELEQTQVNLNLQIKQSIREIESLKQFQEQAAAYRHDLRHHLLFLSACLENNAIAQAQEYIKNLNEEITGQKLEQYCENTAVNLVLSAYIGKMKEEGISYHADVQLGNQLSVSDSDLCVLFSNALENAFHACRDMKKRGMDSYVELRVYEKGTRAFLEIINSRDQKVEFENGRPVSRQNGHGIGVKSICAIVGKYEGVYDFDCEDGKFILRLSI